MKLVKSLFMKRLRVSWDTATLLRFVLEGAVKLGKNASFSSLQSTCHLSYIIALGELIGEQFTCGCGFLSLQLLFVPDLSCRKR